MNKTLPLLDLAVLVIFLVAMMAMGVWFGRKNKTPDQFMKAGGAVPGWGRVVGSQGSKWPSPKAIRRASRGGDEKKLVTKPIIAAKWTTL